MTVACQFYSKPSVSLKSCMRESKFGFLTNAAARAQYCCLLLAIGLNFQKIFVPSKVRQTFGVILKSDFPPNVRQTFREIQVAATNPRLIWMQNIPKGLQYDHGDLFIVARTKLT